MANDVTVAQGVLSGICIVSYIAIIFIDVAGVAMFVGGMGLKALLPDIVTALAAPLYYSDKALDQVEGR